MTNADAAKFREDLAVGSEEPREEVAPLETTPEPGAKATEETAEVEKSVSQNEFNKVYFRQKQAERDKAALEQKVRELETQQPAPIETEVPAPTLENHDYDDDSYNSAMIDFKVKQGVDKAISTFTQDQQKNQTQQVKAELSQRFDANLADYASKNPDYVKAMESAGNMQYSSAVNEVLLNSDKGPQLDHYLLTNPLKAEEFNRMNTVQAAMALGQVAATFEDKPQLTSAPAPIDVETGGGGSVTQDLSDENLSMEDYMKLTRGG